MGKCNFCKFDKKRIENTIIEETENFYVMPTLGSLVDGYVLIVSKKHINSMNELTGKEKEEYFNLLSKYYNRFAEVYGKNPIVFEHGTIDTNNTASSVIHAHTHIVNHEYKSQEFMIKNLNLKPISKEIDFENKSYIFFIDNNFNFFISYEFNPVSQLMRRYIAEDLGLANMYDWKRYHFIENLKSTINKLK